MLLLTDKGQGVGVPGPFGKKLRAGTRLTFGEGALTAEIVDVLEGGNRLVRFDYEGIFLETLEKLGKMPCRPISGGFGPERYQTVYSRSGRRRRAPRRGSTSRQIAGTIAARAWASAM